MRLPARFSKLGMRPVDGKPRTEGEKLVELRARVEDTAAFADAQRDDFLYFREYHDGDGQRDKFLDELDEELQSEFIVTNYTRALIAHLVSIISRSLGTWFVVAADESMKPGADRLQTHLQALRWRDNHAVHIREWLEDAAVCGVGWLRPYYDRDEERVRLEALDAMTVYVEHGAARVDEAEFIAIRHLYNEAYAQEEWEQLDLEAAGRATDQDRRHRDDPQGPVVHEQIEVWEVYHEFGRKLTIYSGDQVLWTGAAPLGDTGYPLFPFTFWPSRSSVYGYSLIKDIEYLQDMVNKARTRLAIWQRFATNPMWWTDDPSAQIVNEPGGMVQTMPGRQAKLQNPPEMPAELFGLSDMGERSLDTVTGIQEIQRGIKPKGVTAGVALDSLLQASEQRMASPLDGATAVLTEVGRWLVGLIQLYYRAQTSVPMMRDGDPALATIYPQDLAQRVPRRREDGVTEITLKPNEFHVMMQPAGDLPMSPAAKRQEAYELFDRGAIDEIALLEVVQFEGRDEVIQRKAAQLQAMMQGQLAGVRDGREMAQAQAQAQQMQMLG